MARHALPDDTVPEAPGKCDPHCGWCNPEPPWWYEDIWVRALIHVFTSCFAAIGVFRIVLYCVTGG